MKKILDCKITTHSGTQFNNPLKLSEIRLILDMVKENKSVEVMISEITDKQYKTIFGK